MDFSEIPSLAACFAGGGDSGASVGASQDVVGVVPSSTPASGVVAGETGLRTAAVAPVPSVVVGLPSATAPVVAGIESVAAGDKGVASTGGGASRKRSIDAGSSREVPPSKVRRVVKNVTPVVGDGPSDVEKAVFHPFEHAFGGMASECGDLFKLFRSHGADESYPLDDSERSRWYMEYARHTVVAAKFANRLVDSQAHELDAMRMELDKVKAELAAAKDGAVTKEVATWRSKYDVERAASLAARREVDVLTAKMAEEAGRAKKWKETEIARFGKSRERLETRCTRAIARHDEILATCNLRSEKTRQFVEQQPLIRRAMYGVNQIIRVFEAVEIWRAESIVISESKVDHQAGAR